MAGTISMGARREIMVVVTERYRGAGRAEKGRIIDELRGDGLASQARGAGAAWRLDASDADGEPAARGASYGVSIKDALTALWEASIGSAASG